jgi:hypothetical protein
MVDAISFSTTAAARQNEINAKATDVATTTLAVITVRESPLRRSPLGEEEDDVFIRPGDSI